MARPLRGPRLLIQAAWGLVLLSGLIGSSGQAATTIDVMIRPNPGDEHVWDALKQGFEQAHPDIKVNYIKASFGEYFQKIQVMYAGGSAPDVIFPNTSYAVQYALQGILLPLDDLARQDRFDLNQYFQPIIDQYRVGGKLYALPNDFAAQAYIYNADHFAAQGIRAPGVDWTWDDFVAIGRKLTVDTNGDGKIDRFASTSPPAQYLIWSALGTNYFDDELRPQKFLLKSPEAYAALQFYQDLRWEHHVIPQPGEPADFYAGTASMMILGHWTIPVVLDRATFDWGLLSIPRSRYSVQRKDGSGWAIMSPTRHRNEAWKFVRFAGGAEGQLLLAREQFITPGHRRVATSPEWQRIPDHPGVSKEPFVHGLNHAFNNYISVHPRTNDLVGLINPAIGKVFDKKETPRGAIEAIAPAVEQLLATIASEK